MKSDYTVLSGTKKSGEPIFYIYDRNTGQIVGSYDDLESAQADVDHQNNFDDWVEWRMNQNEK